MVKSIKQIFAAIMIVPLLCSFDSEHRGDIEKDFAYSKGENITTYSIGEDTKNVCSDDISDVNDDEGSDSENLFYVDLGRRNGWIGQFAKVRITSYKKYDTSNDDGYILAYDNLVQSDGLDSINITFKASYSETYSFAYSSSMEVGFSNALSAKLDIDGFGQIGSGNTISTSNTINSEFQYSVSETKEFAHEYQFNPYSAPKGYLCAVGLVCDATVIEFKYSIFDIYWWGKYVSRDVNERNATNRILIYDTSSIITTMVVRSRSDKGNPTHYLI